MEGVADKLLWAVENGDTSEASILLKEVKDVNAQLKNGRNALHYAADYGQNEVLDILLLSGCDINLEDKFGITPLLAAIYEGHARCVELLLKKKAKLGKAPDGRSYIDCTESKEIKDLIQKYSSH